MGDAVLAWAVMAVIGATFVGLWVAVEASHAYPGEAAPPMGCARVRRARRRRAVFRGAAYGGGGGS